MRYVIRLMFVGVLCAALLGGCESRTGKTVGQTVDDASLTASVKTKLAAEQAATLTAVNVDTHQGVVSLSGTVESEALKQRAATLAQETQGVSRVVNNLQVRAGG
jgi:hyperosmotically inducible protein